MFEVVIYKFSSSLWATGHQYYIISFIFHILVVHGMYKLASSEDARSYLSGFLQRPLIPPTCRLYLYISILPFPIQLRIYTGESSFPLSHLLSIHTPIHCLTLSPPSRPTHLLFSPSLLLCVFCFGAVIFRLISEVMHFLQIKEEARLPPPPSSSSSNPPSLPSSSFSPSLVSRSRPPRPPRPERR